MCCQSHEKPFRRDPPAPHIAEPANLLRHNVCCVTTRRNRNWILQPISGAHISWWPDGDAESSRRKMIFGYCAGSRCPPVVAQIRRDATVDSATAPTPATMPRTGWSSAQPSNAIDVAVAAASAPGDAASSRLCVGECAGSSASSGVCKGDLEDGQKSAADMGTSSYPVCRMDTVECFPHSRVESSSVRGRSSYCGRSSCPAITSRSSQDPSRSMGVGRELRSGCGKTGERGDVE